MDMSYKIVFTDEGQARQWMGEMSLLNQDTANLITEVSRELVDLGVTSTGELIDQVTTAGNSLCSGVSEVLDSMTGVVTAVGGVIDSLTGLVDSVTGAVKAIGGIFGLGG